MRNPNEWLELDGRKAPVYYICGYIPSRQGGDPISESILKLKQGNFTAIHFWLRYLLDDFLPLESDLQDIMVRALGHREMQVTPKSEAQQPLAYLCEKTRRPSRIRYPFQMLKKVRETQPLKFLTKEQRWNTLQDVYQVGDGFTRRQFRTCWFVDDIITTGATARAVWKALLDQYPDIDFRVYALARTVYDPEYNSDLSADVPYGSRWQSYFPAAEEPAEGYGDKLLDIRDLPMPDFSNQNTFFL
ncbi:ComF family protein [Sphingobacterium sp. SYP-B4668]|uniref:ComF family protein n=1 Tax=Sphingobacterium sp. SYP-B4668 TaxID=2996035 RepID=UPI0022DDC24E|nr:hypothetical protein [Sphingobacterium sp. SYP-B4668]